MHLYAWCIALMKLRMNASEAEESISMESQFIRILAVEFGAKVEQLVQFFRATSEVVGIICDEEGADSIAKGTISGRTCSKGSSLS